MRTLSLACLLSFFLLACREQPKTENPPNKTAQTVSDKDKDEEEKPKEEPPARNEQEVHREYPYQKIVQKLPNGIRFSVCGADTTKQFEPTTNLYEALCQVFDAEIEGYSTTPTDAALRVRPAWAQRNGFLTALSTAYEHHHPLRLSPDMVWLLICQGVSVHFNVEGERLREKLVSHTGKKEIVIEEHRFKKYAYNPWQNFLPKLGDSIKQYTKGDLYGKFVKNFSTTTATETIAYQTTLLEALSVFFEYTNESGCGIPYITLEGTPEDWRKIRRDMEAFAEYGLTEWVEALRPVLDEFVNASEGKVNEYFWRDIYKLENFYGGQLNGWCIKFFPYLVDDLVLIGSYSDKPTPRGYYNLQKMKRNPYLKTPIDPKKIRLELRDFPKGCSRVDFKWKYDRDGLKTVFDMVFASGFVGFTEDRATHELRPLIHWAVFDKNAPKYDPKPVPTRAADRTEK